MNHRNRPPDSSLKVKLMLIKSFDCVNSPNHVIIEENHIKVKIKDHSPIFTHSKEFKIDINKMYNVSCNISSEIEYHEFSDYYLATLFITWLDNIHNQINKINLDEMKFSLEHPPFVSSSKESEFTGKTYTPPKNTAYFKINLCCQNRFWKLSEDSFTFSNVIVQEIPKVFVNNIETTSQLLNNERNIVIFAYGNEIENIDLILNYRIEELNKTFSVPFKGQSTHFTGLCGGSEVLQDLSLQDKLKQDMEYIGHTFFMEKTGK